MGGSEGDAMSTGVWAKSAGKNAKQWHRIVRGRVTVKGGAVAVAKCKATLRSPAYHQWRGPQDPTLAEGACGKCLAVATRG